jgi:hypothetical protein
MAYLQNGTNGLVLDPLTGDLELGGNLTHNTSIDANGNRFELGQTSETYLYSVGITTIKANGGISLQTPNVTAFTATTGQVLAIDSVTNLSEFVTLDIRNVFTPIEQVDVDTLLDSTHYTVLVDATSNVTIYLPDAADYFGKIFNIKKIDSSVGGLMVIDAGGYTIDGTSTVSTITQYASYTVQSNGGAGGWFIIN